MYGGYGRKSPEKVYGNNDNDAEHDMERFRYSRRHKS